MVDGIRPIQDEHTSIERDFIRQMTLSQQQLCSRVLQHVANSLLWIRRVNRHIRTASLQDREDAYDHVHRALGHETD